MENGCGNRNDHKDVDSTTLSYPKQALRSVRHSNSPISNSRQINGLFS